MEYDDAEKYCSQLAEYYFNTRYQKYQKGELTGSYIAVNVIEGLCIKGRRKLSRENLNPESGDYRFAKLGRLFKEEAEAVLPLIKKALEKM